MKLKLTLFSAFTLFTLFAFSQDKKPQAVGLHFNLVDFKSIKSFNSPETGKGYSGFKDMSKGFSFSYWRGLTTKIDLAVKANVVFYDFASINKSVTGKQEIGVELEPTANIRPFSDAAKLAPFLTLGAGVGLYNDEIGAYIPAGGGFQLNLDKFAYIFVQAQYRFTLTKKVLGDNLFYSIGFAQKF